jgi:tetratricopeptide (TPR) repeat protein
MSAHDYGESGFSKRQAGDFDGAISQLTIGIALDPDDDFLYLQRAASEEGKKDFAAAISDWTQIIRVRTVKWHWFNMLDDYYDSRAADKQRIGDFKGAIDDYTSAIKAKLKYHYESNHPFYLRAAAEFAIADEADALSDLYLYAKSEDERLRPGRESQAIRKRGLSCLEAIFAPYHNIYESYVAGTMEANQKAEMPLKQQQAIESEMRKKEDALDKRMANVHQLVFHLAASPEALELEKETEAVIEKVNYRTITDGSTPFKPVTKDEQNDAEKQIDKLIDELQKLPKMTPQEAEKELNAVPLIDDGGPNAGSD